MSSEHWQGGLVFHPVYNMVRRQENQDNVLAGVTISLRVTSFVLLPSCSAIHFRQASLFVPHSIQLRGHKLPET
jgi:hypothetical protein